MKREMQFSGGMQSASVDKSQGVGAQPDAEDTVADRARNAREEVRRRQPTGAFDARAFRDLSQAVPIDPRSLRRTIRRSELRQIVPLADSTIYELERRGEFPRRFFLTSRCVVWDLAEVEAWVEARRQAANAAQLKRAPTPDVRRRKRRPVKVKAPPAP